MHTVLLLLGGNIGRVKDNFASAISRLELHGKIAGVSGLYRTEAWGMGADVPDFLNQAVILRTTLSPVELLKLTLSIEAEFGRLRANVAYQSRPLDIDILLVDNSVIDSPELTVPHPRMHLRNFTLLPAAEIAGDWRHPVLGKSIETLMKESADPLEAELI